MAHPPFECWLCQSADMKCVKQSNVKGLNSQSFAISDSNYGVTGTLYRCNSCGFIQCVDFDDVLPFYQGLQDPSYVASRAERELQFKKILETIQKHHPPGTLLDIGAVVGILVEQALAAGYQAEGIEPSDWLREKALERGLPVRGGTFSAQSGRHYDVIALIDVIEHIPFFMTMLNGVRQSLAAGGIVVVTTPMVDSLVARLLGDKWWHFRVAHVGYFNRRTLDAAMQRAGFQLVARSSPTWYFPGDYVFQRTMKYLPGFLRLKKTPGWIERMVVPVNLFDSILAVYRAKE